MKASSLCLRDLYRLTELPGDNPLKAAQSELDVAVKLAYGIDAKSDVLSFLLALNLEIASLEISGDAVQGPGLPAGIKEGKQLISTDRVDMAGGPRLADAVSTYKQ
jgi:hypothetical protein